MPERPGEAERSGRLLPPGTGTEAGLCRGTRQPGQGFGADRRSSGRGRLLPHCFVTQFPVYLRALQIGGAPRRQTPGGGSGCTASVAGRYGVDGRATNVSCTSAWPKSWTRGRVCGGRRAPRSGQRSATVRVARVRPGVRPEKGSLRITRMIAVCTPDFFERVRRLWVGNGDPGLHRGAAAFRDDAHRTILAGHSQVFGAEEIKLALDTMAEIGGQGADFSEGLRRLNRPTVQRLASRHLERLAPLSGTAFRVVDKMPDNYFHLGLLASLFPRAKFIHCRRDLRNVAVSCWMTHFQNIPWANDQQHIASRFLGYQRIMEHWQKVLPVPLLEVDYEETVADLEGVARKLLDWCELAWEPTCLEFYRAKRPVRTASAVQVRQPVFRTSVGRWKHYEHTLASLFARLEGGSGV